MGCNTVSTWYYGTVTNLADTASDSAIPVTYTELNATEQGVLVVL